MIFLWVRTIFAADIHISVVDKRSTSVLDAYVELISIDGTGRAQKKEAVIDQVDKEFVPLVSAVPMGSTVLFPNSDNIQHQIYSFSKSKSFELPLFAKNEKNTVEFPLSGIVHMGCNIHDWMLSYLYVYESQWFTQVNAEGKASFTGIKEGTYTLRVWSPRLKNNRVPVETEVLIRDGAVQNVEQVIKIRKKIRRRPRNEEDEYE